MDETKVTTILREAGFSTSDIDSMTQEGVDNELLKLGYDTHGEKLPQGSPSQPAAQVLEKVEFDEYTLSGSAENTLNIGNYSSAKRGVFVGRKLQVPRDLPEEKRYELLRDETKKLQFLAEAQLSGICMEAMGPEGFNDTSWHNIVSKVFTRASARVKSLFQPKDASQA